MFVYLDEKGLLEDSTIVVTSDHGEIFGEHGLWVHSNSLYEEAVRIPLLISFPGTINAGQVLTAPVHMMDITPTLLEMVGLPIPDHMNGESLLPTMQGAPATKNRLIVSEMAGATDPDALTYWIAPHADLYSVKKDGWKLIHTKQAPQLDELYNLRDASIYEQGNLVSDETEKADELFAEMQDFF